jgi:uncharacterized protein (TIGR02453 family)
MKEVIAFLSQLQQNNNREWFNEHKNEFLQVQARFNDFIEKLIKGIAGFDENISGLTVKDCTYRIYRDTRFSSDKTPYKCHMGAFINPGGKKSGYAGYYFQVGATDEGFPNGNMLASGDYCFEPAVMKILREDICNGEGDFDRIVKQAKPFQIDSSEMLKRNPSGFPADAPYPEYLRLKTFCLTYQPGRSFMYSDHLLEELIELFRPTQPFLEYINRAIAFTRE